MRRPWVILLTLALTTSAPPAPCEDLEYQVKAAFLLNFARFSEWPSRAFGGPDASLVICTFAENPFGDTLAQTIASERAAGHPLQARVIGSPADLRQCHMVFVPRGRTRRTADLVAARGDRSVLLIGEQNGFLAAGGDINLTLEDGRVRFEINPRQDRRSVRFSSHLLRLAKNAGQVVP